LVFSGQLMEQARRLLDDLGASRQKLAVAESCTGGLIAALLTEVPGSSAVFDRGFVTYSNDAKTEALGVPAALITTHGAVSGEVARAMAEGVLARSLADFAVSVTGVAGPGGGSAAKPVGLVYFGVAQRHRPSVDHRCLFEGHGRRAIRLAATQHAITLLQAAVTAHKLDQTSS
jgi:nicotinamide-nucleotide amidase